MLFHRGQRWLENTSREICGEDHSARSVLYIQQEQKFDKKVFIMPLYIYMDR